MNRRVERCERHLGEWSWGADGATTLIVSSHLQRQIKETMPIAVSCFTLH